MDNHCFTHSSVGWRNMSRTADPIKPIDLLEYRTRQLENQVKRLQEDMEFMKTEFRKVKDKKEEKKEEAEEEVGSSWWWA